MITDIIEVNNFVVLIEYSFTHESTVEKCDLTDQVIGISFYGSGEVELSVSYDNTSEILQNSTGMAVSFFGDEKVRFSHHISSKVPLRTISIFSTLKNIQKLPEQEFQLYQKYLNSLIEPKDSFVVGPHFYMTPDMQNAVNKIFNCSYSGVPRMLFLKSQVTELLSHFYTQLGSKEREKVKKADVDKLFAVKEILFNNLNNPPSLSELSKMIGLNSTKLKTNFKELFGVPVFKFLQNERLNKANELLNSTDKSVQEVAWFVGYESLSSFSNAYKQKFGYRPSNRKK